MDLPLSETYIPLQNLDGDDSKDESGHVIEPTLTIRFWILSIISTSLLSFMNQIFAFRTRPISIPVLVAQLLLYPLGVMMARTFPRRKIRVLWWTVDLNPGDFNLKEQVLIYACCNAANGTAYAIDIITIKRVYYGSEMGFLGSLMLVLTSQIIGYGLAGFVQRILVQPAAMVWPDTLVTMSLLRTLHSKGSSIKFFGKIAMIAFLYHLLPGYFFSALSCISVLCILAPNSNLMGALGSGTKGLGMLSFSFSWNTITAFLGSPLITPFWAQLNIFCGFIAFAWILLPLGYFSNWWMAQSFPVFSSKLFREDGEVYDPLLLINRHTQSFNETAYELYGPLRLSYMFAMSYGMGFAVLTAVLSHTFLYHGADIYRQISQISADADYEEVPRKWFFLLFVLSLIPALWVCESPEVHLPWWGLFLAIGIAAVFVLPVGIIAAITNQTPGLNVVTEFVAGMLFPGRPIANVTFKTFGYISMSQALQFIGDLKLAHYAKVPPRQMFVSQLVGTVLAGVVNLLTAMMVFYFVPELCHHDGDWGCASINVFYAASVIWGVIGPARMFGVSSQYHILVWFFVLGLVVPVIPWLLSRRYPNSLWPYVHTPLLFGATASMPPAQPVMYVSWFITGWLGYRYLATSWHSQIVSAGLNTGVAVAAFAIFAFRGIGISLDWWGNAPDCEFYSGGK